jgi:hypothetical protein
MNTRNGNSKMLIGIVIAMFSVSLGTWLSSYVYGSIEDSKACISQNKSDIAALRECVIGINGKLDYIVKRLDNIYDTR